MTLLQAIASRGVTRICHFTPSRNLAHILRGEVGVLASAKLRADERAVLNPTDLERFDGHLGHICCSVQYPNAWYFAKARAKENLFLDWVVLLLKPGLLLLPDAKFSPRNAAAGSGAFLVPGKEGFEAMYAPQISGAYGKNYQRPAGRLPSVPTDDQAEALIPDAAPLSTLIAVAVRTKEQAATEKARLQQAQLRAPRIVVAPAFYEKYTLSCALRDGQVPAEETFSEPE